MNAGSLERGSAGSLRTEISELTTAQSVRCPTVLLVLPVERLCPQKTVIMQYVFKKIMYSYTISRNSMNKRNKLSLNFLI